MTATIPSTSQRLRDALGAQYAIDRELGRGGMATVYLAQDLRHDRLVALKVLHPDVAASLGADRFLHEIKTAARLNHPHILPLFDSGAAEGFLYYVMPYVEGESLRQALDRLGQIPLGDAISYTREMAAALDYAHRQGIVHRDIKPENVMLHEGIAMLMDFGIAKAFEKKFAENLTSTGMIVGTPAYMSPEQAVGESSINGKSDQYSLACVVHEMIAGQQLFAGRSAHAVIAMRLSSNGPDFTDIADRVPEEVISALTRATSLDAADRFDTMREFASALASASRTTPVSMRFEAPVISASKSVAVLPFENLSADVENEYLADGIAEEIINALSKVRTLRVASRASSFAVKGRRNDLQEAGRKLKVSTVLNGSVRRSGNRIRVTAELVNVSDGSQLWAERYDREMEDVFAIQDDISEAIVRALRIILGDAERKALKAKTRDIRAYEYYLRGRQYQDLRKKGIEYAMQMFRHAIEIDPEYASAYAGTADCLSLMYLLFDADMKYVDEAKKYAEKALELEPDLAEAHLAKAMAYSCLRDYDTSNAEFEKASKLDPKLFDVPYYWARNLQWQGRPEDALKVMRVGLALRPESFDVAIMVAMVYTGMGKKAEAEAARKHAIKLMEDRLELNPDDARAWSLAGSAYAAANDRERAEKAIERAIAIDQDALTIYNAACAYALLGDREKALDNLELAVRSGWKHRQWLEHDSDFDLVRSDPRFMKVVESL
jgi:serine/threonine protein kinase/tetratricopeptide (TPR) repeat protein